MGDAIGEEDKIADVFVAESRIMMVEDSINDASGQIPILGNVPTETCMVDSKNPGFGFDATQPFGDTKLGNGAKKGTVDEMPQDELANVVQERGGENFRRRSKIAVRGCDL